MNSNTAAKELLKRLSAQRRADRRPFVSPARAAYAAAKQAADVTNAGRRAATELLEDHNVSKSPAGWSKMSPDERDAWVFKNLGSLTMDESENVLRAIARLEEIS